MRKVGITTVHTGYNYGSLLQAYSMQEYIQILGFDSEIFWCKDGLVKGRDVRVKKLLVMFFRTVFRPKLFCNNFLSYTTSINYSLDAKSRELFDKFSETRFKITKNSDNEMKRFANSNRYHAFICGSDQIWDSTTSYVDPLYYLRFSSSTKRIAYAPSFGKNTIPKYNQKIIKKYISEIPYLSVREKQGQKIIKELIGREVPILIDPTLLLNKNFWEERINKTKRKPYILIYFLNHPSKFALKQINQIRTDMNIDTIAIPYFFEEYDSDIKFLSTGPLEFIELVNNSAFVCTDSFHGTAFSINMNVPFFVFERMYSKVANQSSRIESLLALFKLENRYIKIDVKNRDYLNMSFKEVNKKLERERKKSKAYLENALNKRR